MHEVVSERQVHEQADLMSVVEPSQSTITKLADVVRHNIANAVFIRLYAVLAAENLDDADPLHDFFVERYATARELVILSLRASKAAGEVRADVAEEQIACEVVAMLMGLEMQWLMDPDQVDLVARVDAYAHTLTEQLAPEER